ncbi:MAG: glycoside hydrolase family 5 protein [Fibrobacteres bacterium]|nr:glycoside hydrolase family 5 protein [Fibrobacterota bacterium]
MGLSALCAPSAFAQASRPFLKTDGIYIRNGNGTGDTVWLYGVNFGGLFVHEPWMSPLAGPTTEWDSRTTLETRFGKPAAQKLLATYWDSWATAVDFKNIAADGMNCVRMPVYFLDFMDDNGNWRMDSVTKAIDFARIDKLVNAATAAGVFTVLDLHGAPGSQNGNQHSGKTTGANLYTTPRYQDMLIKFWTGMADHFKDNPAIAGYDLLNEPSSTFPGAMGQNVVDLYDRSYKAIRTLDSNHIVFMEAIWAWNLLPDPKTKGWSNVSYSLHYYQWTNNSDFNTMKTFFDGKISDAKTWSVKYQVPHFAGEFTLFGNPQVWDYGMTAIVKENWNWTFWSYKVTGTNSSWGLYTAKNPGPNTPNVNTDTYDQILQKWGHWDTPTYFTRNAMVGDAVKKAALLRPVVRPTLTPTSVAGRGKEQGLALRLSGRALAISLPQAGTWRVTLRNLRGKAVRSLRAEGKSFSMPAEGLENGVYGVTVDGADQSYSGRIVIER